ncbi:gamma-aminobutyric acid receptor subunit rho-2 [Eurytemora carolleeae]|uniref:gamma-aminobutyric acid receptor subunit rho-2 n=1 Tax=Eurytemora carolleeae TaxID=1294199 RepID=UPI000C764C1C|nr:gamma-aminobutyric acid receptor subunit rho-2 [Eurytemora carolleeae]|eukprot:XP_023336143.1 gamma-aminobutyric acid receptor subunit rho-2-like [Eurytemora affinis]
MLLSSILLLILHNTGAARLKPDHHQTKLFNNELKRRNNPDGEWRRGEDGINGLYSRLLNQQEEEDEEERRDEEERSASSRLNWTQCSHGFCIDKNYNKMDLPPPNFGSNLVQIVLEPHVIEIFKVDAKESSITLSMYLGVRWEDGRIANLNATIEDLQGVELSFLKHLWRPDIEMHHIRHIQEPKMLGEYVAGIQINRGKKRTVFYSQVLVTTITCPMRFSSFPFDNHKCPFLFGSFTYDHSFLESSADITFLTRVYQQNTNLDYDIEFEEMNHDQEEIAYIKNEQNRIHLYDNGRLGNLSLAGFKLRIYRHYYKHLLVYYLPSSLFVIVSWASFVIPPEVVAGRMGLLITILLCLVNIFNSANEISPNVKVPVQGVTALSLWVLACLLFVFSSVVSYTAILSLGLIKVLRCRTSNQQFENTQLWKENIIGRPAMQVRFNHTVVTRSNWNIYRVSKNTVVVAREGSKSQVES